MRMPSRQIRRSHRFRVSFSVISYKKPGEKSGASVVRIGKILDGADTLISEIQSKLDDAKAQGKDVSAVQTALDAFSAAVKNVQPTYSDMQTIVQSHSGFDASGNVTDQTQALQTVQSFQVIC